MNTPTERPTRPRRPRGGGPSRTPLLEPLEPRQLLATAAGFLPATTSHAPGGFTIAPDLITTTVASETRLELPSYAFPAGETTPVSGVVVMDDQANPGGAVALLVDGAQVASADLVGFTFTANVPGLPPGRHTIEADYQGTAVTSGTTTTDYAPSKSSPATFYVGPLLTVTPTAPQPGDPVTFTVVVAPPGQGAGGTVDFRDYGTIFGTAPVVDGKAVLTATLSAGTHVIKAPYNGGGNYPDTFPASTPAVLTLVVGTPSVPTTTTLTVAPAGTALLGQALTLTADVSSPDGPVPGDVLFYDKNGNVVGAVHARDLHDVSVTVQTPYPGPNAFTAVFAAQVDTTGGVPRPFGASTSGPVNLTVNPVVSLTPAGSGSNAVQVPQGQPLTLTAVVVAAAGPATGTVTFDLAPDSFLTPYPPSTLGTVPVVNGQAVLAAAGLPQGDFLIRAHYSGDASRPAGDSIDQEFQVINPNGATPFLKTVLTSTRTPSVFGQPVTFSVGDYAPSIPLNHGLTSPGAPLVGTVTYNIDSKDVATGAVNGNTGLVSSYTTAALGVGSHFVVARYSGGPGVGGSSVAYITQVVAAPTLPPVVAPIGDKSVRVGSLLAFRATATNPYGGAGLTFGLAPGAPRGAKIDPTTGVFTLTGATPGRYQVTVDAAYAGLGDSPVGRQTFRLTVAAAPPVVTLGRAAATTTGGAPFTDAGSFTSRAAGPFVAAVDYGDGTGLHRLAVGPRGAFRLAHAYARPGTYTVVVGVRDGSGLVGRRSVTETASAPLFRGFRPGRITPAAFCNR